MENFQFHLQLMLMFEIVYEVGPILSSRWFCRSSVCSPVAIWFPQQPWKVTSFSGLSMLENFAPPPPPTKILNTTHQMFGRIAIWFLVTQEPLRSAESQLEAVPMHTIWSRSLIIHSDIVIIYSHSSIAYWSSLWNIAGSPMDNTIWQNFAPKFWAQQIGELRRSNASFGCRKCIKLRIQPSCLSATNLHLQFASPLTRWM